MALSITVNGGGTFSASMEEGPVSFTASLGAVPGPKGDTGATGPAGVVAATAPITYNSGTQTVGISATPTFTSVTATTLTTTNLAFADATTQTTAFVGEARKVYVTARNNTGSTIAAGKVVYLSGATGNKPTIALAQANAEGTSARVIGLTVESIANNADGKVVISGSAENIDTSAFNAGDVVYLSATTAGGMTTTLPTQPYHGVAIGIITRANSSVGSVEVSINNYQELEELSDVLIGTKANNDLISWDSASSTWKNKTFATLDLLTATTAASTYAPLASPTFTGTVTIPAGASISGYLTTATAASTYAPLASPTFTGTVTIPAGASISGYLTTATAASTYAPIASPTFTGDPKAPTPSTSDNDTSIATTAFVNSYCPAASTTTAGKVELATDAETSTGTSTTLAVTPSNIRDYYHLGWLFPDYSASTAVTSTGTTSVGVFGMRCALTSTLSGQHGARYFGNASLATPYGPSGSTITTTSFSKRMKLAFRFAITGRSNITGRISYGKETGTGVGNLSQRGFGIRIVSTGAVELQVHDGTTLTNVTSSFTPTGATWADAIIDSDGAGTVKLYINGSEVASTTGGPTGAAAGSVYPTVWHELEASGSSSGLQAIFWANGFALSLD